MKTLKHYLMILLILFSGWSTSWAGVVMSASHGGGVHSATVEVEMTQTHSAADHVQMMHHAEHDCCASDVVSVADQDLSHTSDCPYCGDDCNCAQVCHLLSPLATLKGHAYFFSFTQQTVKASFHVSVPQAPVTQLERPPKTV